MARNTQTVEPKSSNETGKKAKKKPGEPATPEERKKVLDAALAILEKRRGKKSGSKPAAKAAPKPKRRAAATRKTRKKIERKPASVPDLPLPEETAPNGLPKPREVKVKGKLFSKKPLNPTTKAMKTEPGQMSVSDKEKKKAIAERATEKSVPTFGDTPVTVHKTADSGKLARMKEEMLKDEYERKIAAEREARLRAEARVRVDDTTRKIIKAEREEKRRIKEDLESKLKMETEAKSGIIKELDELKRELAYLRTGTNERKKTEGDIMQLRRMLADKDREIFSYKKQIDEQADRKITAIIETLQSKKSPRTIAEKKPEVAAVKKDEPVSKTDSVFEIVGDIEDRNPIFDGLPTLELEKTEEEKKPMPAPVQKSKIPSADKPFNRIAQYLATSRKKSNRWRQALLVMLPVAFLFLIVLGARAFFSKAPVDVAEGTQDEAQLMSVEDPDGPEVSPWNQAEEVAIPSNRYPGSSYGEEAGNHAAGETPFAPVKEPVRWEPPAPEPEPVVVDQIYKVQPGDSLWVICKKFYGSGIYHEALSKYNSLKKGQLLRIGLELKVPTKEILLASAKSN
ncbi:MAG: LysM peptidoglycan-binding domain-containing protein [Planctomycetota bacterium]